MGSPALYLFLAATVLLSLGHLWGMRRNRLIVKRAFDALAEAIDPADRVFTRIGGSVGYHAVFTPKDTSRVAAADATITLLAREAWLYYPVSLLTRRFDRLYVTLHLKAGDGEAWDIERGGEAHLIEERFAAFRGPKIARAGALRRETVPWGASRFLLYWESDGGRRRLRDLMDRLPAPGVLRHVAVVPARGHVHVFMIPRPREVAAVFGQVYAWRRFP